MRVLPCTGDLRRNKRDNICSLISPFHKFGFLRLDAKRRVTTLTKPIAIPSLSFFLFFWNWLQILKNKYLTSPPGAQMDTPRLPGVWGGTIRLHSPGAIPSWITQVLTSMSTNWSFICSFLCKSGMWLLVTNDLFNPRPNGLHKHAKSKSPYTWKFVSTRMVSYNPFLTSAIYRGFVISIA